MSHTSYYLDTDYPSNDEKQAGQTAAGTMAATPDSGVPCSAAAPLFSVAAALLRGNCQRELKTGIDAGNYRMGNRAFMGWVGKMQTLAGEWSGRRAAPADAVALADPLQLMPKKKKKKAEQGMPETPEAQQESLPEAGATAGTEEQTGPDTPAVAAPGVTPEQGKIGEAGAPAGKKKKKKSRVQVALNTLRLEGVEAFGAYVYAGVGEAVLLHNLRDRLLRAEDLDCIKGPALRIVEEQMRVLDTAPAPQAVTEQENTPVLPVSAPVKTELSRRERELFAACTRGDWARLRRQLGVMTHDINIAGDYGTLLNVAASGGHTGVVRGLLSRPGIDVNVAKQGDSTPLYTAAQYGHMDIIRLLLGARGLNVNIASPDGTTPLAIASFQGYEEIVSVLLAAPHIKVNVRGCNGATALYLAAQQGREEVVRLLLAAPGININLGTYDGASPLIITVSQGYREVVNLLLAAPGIDMNARKHDGATALLFAAQRGFTEIMRDLIRRGADVNLSIYHGTSPLNITISIGNTQAVRLLLQSPDIRINQTTNTGTTPLATAARVKNEEITRLLLSEGADPNLTNDIGIGPLHIACLRGDTAMARKLLHAGADPDVRVITSDGQSYSSYGLAELMDHRQIVSLLEKYRKFCELRKALPGAPSREDEAGQPASATLATLAPIAQPEQTGPPPPGMPVASAQEETDPAGQVPTGAAPEAPASDLTGAAMPAADTSPLVQGKQALVREVLGKLDEDTLDPLEGIRLMVDVRGTDSLDALCGIYNRLAGIERQRRRARRQGAWRSAYAVEPAAPPLQADIRYTLGAARDLDADELEEEIKRHLGQTYHRFVKQVVNNMEFGRGKHTSGYPGLWHVSAGVPGVGSCSVFYHADEGQARISIVGIGHHVGRAAYELDYAVGELAGAGRTLGLARAPGPLQMMPKKKKKRSGAAAHEADTQQEAQAGATGQVEVETGPELPTPTTIPEQGISGEPGAAAGKKKKKSRVQVALNTLRSEGVEALGGYIETEIGETELLRNLVERIKRAQDLEAVRDAALEIVEGRLRSLDPQSGAAMTQANRGQAVEKAVSAPVRTELTWREAELFKACFKGDVARLKRLLKDGNIDINLPGVNGTFLAVSVYKGHVGIVRELLSRPDIDINLAVRGGATPLHYAVQRKHVELVRLLLAARGIKVNLGNVDQSTPLCVAAYLGNEDIVRMLLAAPGINVNLRKQDGVTALYLAVQEGHEEVVKLLLAAPGINVNIPTMDGLTALIVASALGHRNIVRLLLAAPHINVNIRVRNGATLLYLAAQQGREEDVRLLLAVPGININLATYDGTSPLMIAVTQWHEEVVNLLLAAPGIDANACRDDGATALFVAAQHGFTEIVRLLIRHGADVNLPNYRGTSPLCIAMFQRYIDIVSVLLQAPGIRINQATNTGVTPLAVAARQLDEYSMRLLLSKGADPNLANDIGMTPLHFACLRGDTAKVRLFLRAGADPDARMTIADGQGYSSYGLAELAHRREVMALLQTHSRAPEPPTGAAAQAETSSPLAQGKQALIRGVLGKLNEDTLEPLEGIRMMIDVRGADSLDALCEIYYRLAGIERQRVRAWRQGLWRPAYGVEPGVTEQEAVAWRFVLGAYRGLDAEGVENEIKRYLVQTYHRFVKQAVNNIIFRQGNHTMGFPGLGHVSAGVPGVGRCSVFYRADAAPEYIRIIGIGHRVGRTAYRLDYAVEELAGAGQTLNIA